MLHDPTSGELDASLASYKDCTVFVIPKQHLNVRPKQTSHPNCRSHMRSPVLSVVEHWKFNPSSNVSVTVYRHAQVLLHHLVCLKLSVDWTWLLRIPFLSNAKLLSQHSESSMSKIWSMEKLVDQHRNLSQLESTVISRTEAFIKQQKGALRFQHSLYCSGRVWQILKLQ